jgi:hypothetical protein
LKAGAAAFWAATGRASPLAKQRATRRQQQRREDMLVDPFRHKIRRAPEKQRGRRRHGARRARPNSQAPLALFDTGQANSCSLSAEGWDTQQLAVILPLPVPNQLTSSGYAGGGSYPSGTANGGLSLARARTASRGGRRRLYLRRWR